MPRTGITVTPLRIAFAAVITLLAVLLAVKIAQAAWTSYQCDSECKYSASQLEYTSGGADTWRRVESRHYWGSVDGGLTVDRWRRLWTYDWRHWNGGWITGWTSGSASWHDNRSLASGHYTTGNATTYSPADNLMWGVGIEHKACSSQPCQWQYWTDDFYHLGWP